MLFPPPKSVERAVERPVVDADRRRHHAARLNARPRLRGCRYPVWSVEGDDLPTLHIARDDGDWDVHDLRDPAVFDVLALYGYDAILTDAFPEGRADLATDGHGRPRDPYALVTLGEHRFVVDTRHDEVAFGDLAGWDNVRSIDPPDPRPAAGESVALDGDGVTVRTWFGSMELTDGDVDAHARFDLLLRFADGTHTKTDLAVRGALAPMHLPSLLCDRRLLVPLDLLPDDGPTGAPDVEIYKVARVDGPAPEGSPALEDVLAAVAPGGPVVAAVTRFGTPIGR